MSRANSVILIVGDRGTGKTTYLKGEPAKGIRGVLPEYLHRNPLKKILIVETFDDENWRHYPPITISQLPTWESGPRRIWSPDVDEMFEAISKHVLNTVLIIEDATKVIYGRLTDDMKHLVLDSKQKNLDIYFIFHFLQAVPPDLTRISDVLTLFKTKEIFDSHMRSKYPNPEIAETFEVVARNKSWYYHKSVKISG